MVIEMLIKVCMIIVMLMLWVEMVVILCEDYYRDAGEAVKQAVSTMVVVVDLAPAMEVVTEVVVASARELEQIVASEEILDEAACR